VQPGIGLALLWAEVAVELTRVIEVTMIFRVLFDDLGNEVFEWLQRLVVAPLLPAGLEEAPELLAVLSEHGMARPSI
jgi:hypothetical protein